MAVVELRRLAEALDHEIVSDLEVLKNGGVRSHKKGGSGRIGRSSEFSSAQLFPKIPELVQGALAASSLLCRGDRGRQRGLERLVRGRSEPDPADLEILFKAVELEEVG